MAAALASAKDAQMAITGSVNNPNRD